MFDTPLCHLPVGGGESLDLDAHDVLVHVLPTPEEVEAGPREKTGDGIEVGPESLAANSRGFERDRAAAAEAVSDSGRVAEGALAELLDEVPADRSRWYRGGR